MSILRGSQILLLAFVSAFVVFPLEAQPPTGSIPRPTYDDCHVYAVDLTEGERLLNALLEHPNAKPEDFKDLAQKVEKILGKFKAEVGEEVTTTKSYPLAGTNQTVTVTVFYTDEMMDFSDSILQGLVIADGPVENAIQAPGASITEVNREASTYKVRTKRRILIQGKPWIVGLECQCMSDEARRAQLNPAPK